MSRSREIGNDPTGFEIGEIGTSEGIEPVEGSAMKLKSKIELEAFMNEHVKIRILPSGRPHDRVVTMPQVNAVNQPIPRGVWVSVRRKYVEAMARNRIETFEQDTPNPMEMEKIRMRGMATLVNPFEIRDPNPKGEEWIDRILAEKR